MPNKKNFSFTLYLETSKIEFGLNSLVKMKASKDRSSDEMFLYELEKYNSLIFTRLFSSGQLVGRS